MDPNSGNDGIEAQLVIADRPKEKHETVKNDEPC